MTILRTALQELLGLFVDDWAFALILVAWVAAFVFVVPRGPGVWQGITFFAGLATITLAFVVRGARRARSR